MASAEKRRKIEHRIANPGEVGFEEIDLKEQIFTITPVDPALDCALLDMRNTPVAPIKLAH